MGDQEHRPVLLNEVIEALNIRPTGSYVDATYGRGGHAKAILERLGDDGRLIAIDRDPQAVAEARLRFAGETRVSVIKGRFSMIRQHLESSGIVPMVDGILMDLGVSSPQLDEGQRGFSFMRSGPLDMRMDPETGAPVSAWLNTAPEADIARVLQEFGEERFARRIARAIVAARAQNPVMDTDTLVAVVRAALPFQDRGKHPATRVFQALRIHVNEELRELEQALPECVQTLRPGGRLAVISFHSMEDRIVKRFIRAQEGRTDELPPDFPVRYQEKTAHLRQVGGLIRPSTAELQANPRARSASLRVAERVHHDL